MILYRISTYFVMDLKNKEGQNPAQAANPAIFQQNMMGQNFQPKINQVSFFNSFLTDCYRKFFSPLTTGNVRF